MSLLDLFRGGSQHRKCASETDLESLRSEFRLLKTEWLEMYDKLTHLADRQRKREKQLVVEKEPLEGPNGADPWAEAFDLAHRKGYL